MKKLSLNEDKCKKIHVGKKNTDCPELHAHDKTMKNSSSEKYIGNYLSEDGKDDKNIEYKAEVGTTASSKIMNILNEVNVGSHHFAVAFLLRQAILLSSMLLNFEASLKISKKNIKLLERVDENLLRRIFSAPKSSPLPSLYLESGTIPVHIQIKGKRLLFLYYLLNQEKNTLLSKILYDQINNPIPNDWVSIASENLSELGLDHYSFKDIKEMKKSKFKSLVKEACKDFALNYLNKEIEKRNLKKLKNIKYSKLEPQDYLTCTEMTTPMKKIIFRARTGMLDVGFNMGKKISCVLCGLGNDDERHLFDCLIIKLSCPEIMENSTASFDDIYSLDMKKVCQAAKLLRKAMRTREVLQDTI